MQGHPSGRGQEKGGLVPTETMQLILIFDFFVGGEDMSCGAENVYLCMQIDF